jgi:hypothetical protein
MASMKRLAQLDAGRENSKNAKVAVLREQRWLVGRHGDAKLAVRESNAIVHSHYPMKMPVAMAAPISPNPMIIPIQGD